jgi:hypothetical protein
MQIFPIRPPSADEYRTTESIKRALAVDTDEIKLETLVRLQLILRERADSINNNERGQLIKLLGSFGMTPADRSKVSIDSTALDELQQYLIKPKPVRPTPAMNSKPAEAIQ